MRRKLLKVGIMSKADFRKRTVAIAKGEYVPRKDEPKIWFESLQSLAQVLSDHNQELLQVIDRERPDSLRTLEELTGRRVSNLSRTLHTLERYGIVELRPAGGRAIRPVAKATDFEVSIGPHTPGFLQWAEQREAEQAV